MPDLDHLPKYRDLPEFPGLGERSSWGVFGRDDDLGTVNFLTEERVRDAAKLVRRGAAFNLDLPLTLPARRPVAPGERGRGPYEHVVTTNRGGGDDHLNNFYLQGSSQWDGLRHIRFRDKGYYTGLQDEDQLKRAMDGIDPRGTKLSVMQDSHKAFAIDVPTKDKSVVDMIRVATYVKDIDKAIHLANSATEKGYETTINIMAISHEGAPFLDEALQQIEEETKVAAVYVVDSFGALYSETVHYLVEKYQMYLKTKEVGVHMHNNQQLAFANTVEGIIKGANYLDGTLYGLGRAAGNCPLELLLGFLKNPKFNMVPILDVIGKVIIPLRDKIEWGYTIPYMLAGVLDRHPQMSMQWVEKGGPNKHNYVEFYKLITDTPEQ